MKLSKLTFVCGAQSSLLYEPLSFSWATLLNSTEGTMHLLIYGQMSDILSAAE